MSDEIRAIDLEGLTSEGLPMHLTCHYRPDQDEPVRIHGFYHARDGNSFFDVTSEADLPFVVSEGTFKPIFIEREGAKS